MIYTFLAAQGLIIIYTFLAAQGLTIIYTFSAQEGLIIIHTYIPSSTRVNYICTFLVARYLLYVQPQQDKG